MRSRIGSALLRGLRRRDTREPGPFNHISLGSHCHMAQLLKATGLRTWSGPFDWIFSAPGLVRDCLADDFALLLDRSQLETTPLDERPKPEECRGRHRIYGPRHQIPFLFNHHDPAGSDADYAFLQEGVRRLRRALAAPDSTNRFYLLTAIPPDEETVLQICDLLAQRPSRNHLTVLEIAEGSLANAVEPRGPERPDLTWLRVATLSASVGLRFADSSDDAFVGGLLRG